MLPTIHGNGTSAQALLDQATGVMDAAAPNGRDYYPQSDAAINRAGLEHAARCQQITALLLEYEALAEHCATAVNREADRRRQHGMANRS